MQSKFGNSIIVTALGIFIWQFSSPVTAETVAEFYQGRSITIHMGFPGGGFFASAQLAGKHMQKHIPGNPKIIFKPRPGRIGTTVLDFLAHWAPKNGTHLAMPGSLGPWLPLQLKVPVKYDPLKLTYIGNVNSEGDTYLFVRSDAGIKTLADLKTKTLRVSNSRGAYKLFVAAINNILGTKITYVGDYPSHQDAFAAMLKDQTQGVAGAGVTINAEHRRYFPNLLKGGKAIPILRYTASTKSTNFPSVVLAGQVGSTTTGKQALEIAFASQVLDRPLMGPPEMEPAQLMALQKAFINAMNDPALIAEAKAKKIGIENPMSGPDMLAYVRKIYALPDAAKIMVKKALADESFVEKVRYSSFKAKLAQIKPKGKSPHAVLIFKGKGNPIVAHLDARTTALTVYGQEIKIPPFKTKSLKAGMKCEVSWTGPGSTASKLVCS